MAKYKAYPEYKDSEVEWLGDIPGHWKTISISRLFFRIKRTGYIEKELLSVYRDYGVIPKSSRDDNNNKPSEDLSPYQLVQPNDLVMNKMKAWQGSIAISEYEGIVSPAYFVYQPNNSLFELAHPKYVHYLLRNPIYVTQYLSRSKGIRVNQWDLDPDEFRNIELLLPSKVEQEKIYNFLDHETAKIDNLIEKQQQLIELLKEKRQAVISHAVTKGLNPDVPMKGSGVEWLGNIPEHWGQSRIGWICNVGNGCTPSRENTLYWQNGSYPWLNSSKVNDERILTAEQYVTNKALYECSLPIVKKGSVIMSITGEGKTRGTSALMMINATINQHVAYITPRAKDKILPEFIHLWLQSKYQQIRISSEGWGSTKAAITCSDVKCYPIPMPPLKEQAEIVSAIEDKKAIFTSLLLNCEQEIEILQERRTALISAAVTGKIDVRDWVVPETQKVEEPQEATA